MPRSVLSADFVLISLNSLVVSYLGDQKTMALHPYMHLLPFLIKVCDCLIEQRRFYQLVDKCTMPPL